MTRLTLTSLRYADRCYACYDHANKCPRDTGALLLCCVSMFSPYPVIGLSDMHKLTGKGNYQNYDAHIVPVVPADASNPLELDYFPCEPQALLHPFAGAARQQPARCITDRTHTAPQALHTLKSCCSRAHKWCRVSLSGCCAAASPVPCCLAPVCLVR